MNTTEEQWTELLERASLEVHEFHALQNAEKESLIEVELA